MRTKTQVIAQLIIRRARVSDSEAIHVAHMRSIREVCAKDYTPAQIAAWGGRKFDADIRRRNIEDDAVWVVECDGIVQGFGHLKKKRISEREVPFVLALYLAPEALGHGAGKKILAEIEATVRNWSFNELFLESTITSLSFYKKQGFEEIGPPCERLINNENIPCHPMKKKLPELG